MTGSILRRGGRLSAASAGTMLALAAAPVFAGLGLASILIDAPVETCMGGGSVLDGMVPMYLAMAVFHLGPWLHRASRPC